MPLDLARPLTEMNTKDLSVCKGRPARKADLNVCEPIDRKM
jgi:hypothetical protein